MNKKNGLSRLTVDLDPERQKQFKKAAIDAGKTMRQILIDLIENFIKKAEKKS